MAKLQPPEISPMRHDLVWLSSAGWDLAIAAARPEQQAALVRWQQHDWPAIVRRHDADAPPDSICLGIPLPPDPDSGAKLRIALRVGRAAMARSSRPLRLRAALPVSAAPQWAALSAQDPDGMLHAYGSCAMQALTGLPYLHPGSDIDLLFYPSDRRQLDAGLALLASQAGSLPLDGEIVFPDGAAVAWKEWLQAIASDSRVLVKRLHAVQLAQPAQLLSTLEHTA